jgi:hypothetical protein
VTDTKALSKTGRGFLPAPPQTGAILEGNAGVSVTVFLRGHQSIGIIVSILLGCFISSMIDGVIGGVSEWTQAPGAPGPNQGI